MKISAGNNLESHDNNDDDDDDDDGYYYYEDLTIINFMFMIFSSTTQETGAESETPVPTAITAEVDPHVSATPTAEVDPCVVATYYCTCILYAVEVITFYVFPVVFPVGGASLVASPLHSDYPSYAPELFKSSSQYMHRYS